MNYTKIFVFVLAIVAIFSIAIVNAPKANALTIPYNPCWFIDCTGNLTADNLAVTIDDTQYYVEDDDTLDVEFTIKNTGNIEGSVTIQIDTSYDDFEDYFTVNGQPSKTVDVLPGEEDTLTFKIYVDHVPDDDYSVKFKIFKYYENQNGNTIDLEDSTKTIHLNVDDFEDIDVELEDNVICYGQEYPAKTYLVFTNDTSKDYYFNDFEIESNEDLWPNVKSHQFEIPNDDETKVEIKFRKEAPLGTYEIEIDQKLHVGSMHSATTRNFNKTLKVYVENCDAYYNSFSVTPQTQNIKTNDRVSFNFYFYNESNTDMPVYLKGIVNDSSMNISFPNDTKLVLANQPYQGTFSVFTSSNTTPGLKTITLTAETPYRTYTKTIQVNVLKSDLSVNSNSIDVPVGLKGKQEIKIQNNTTANVLLALTIEPQGQDVILLNKTALNINAGETQSVYADVIPRSVGSKSYILHIAGSIDKDVTINYTSNSEAGIVNYVSNYLSKANAVNGVWTTLPVVVNNPYNFETTLKLRLLPTDSITSKTSTVILAPKQTKTVEVQFIANTNEKNAKATLEVVSDTTNNTYPVYVIVNPDTSFTNALELPGAPTTIQYTSGESDVTLKVYNPNGFAIKYAQLKLLNVDGNILGSNTFIIGPNATIDVEVNFILDSAEPTTGTIVLTANNSENSYDVAYTKAGFLSTGLFNLGLGGTISILLGALIIILLIVYFSVRNPSVPEIQ